MNDFMNLPTMRSNARIQTLTLVSSIMMGILSLGGIIFPDLFYQSEILFQTFLVNDWINILIGLPFLLLANRLIQHKKLTGLLLLPGAHLYIIYNYLAYIIGRPFDIFSMLYIVLVSLSSLTIVLWLTNLKLEIIQESLSESVPAKLTGWVLSVFGALFFIRAVLSIGEAVFSRSPLPSTELGVLIADMLISTLWVLGGIFLLKKRALGFSVGLGLLFVASQLFVGLVLYLIIQPILTELPFALIDIVVILVMGLMCYIPTALYWRGVVLAEINGI